MVGVRVAPNDPAVRLVTDFSREEPRTIPPDRTLDDALREMVCTGVRALLVVEDELVSGLITSYDIEGRRPLEFIRSSHHLVRGEIAIGHIMTPWRSLSTLDWKTVCAANAGQMEEYFRSTHATHVVLVEEVCHVGPCVRGVISRRRIEREMARTI